MGEGLYINVTLFSYTRAFGDESRNFVSHSQLTTTPELEPSLLTSIPHHREDVSSLERFNVHRCPTRWFWCWARAHDMICHDAIP
ncbi:hypothetical protein TNCV_4225461 [Trichonephila clavipes]|uniref:Uncharacterized protein n=1 Tax=Trichonephila clavipes TaxID=2585209 RepID=A0A8X6T128_TRICX|nr:hypothetical protein TNCV_4225461 [Trichonephila clavipes]